MVPFSKDRMARMIVGPKSLTKLPAWSDRGLYSQVAAQAIWFCLLSNKESGKAWTLHLYSLLFDEKLWTRTWPLGDLYPYPFHQDFYAVSRQMCQREWTSNCRICAGWRRREGKWRGEGGLDAAASGTSAKIGMRASSRKHLLDDVMEPWCCRSSLCAGTTNAGRFCIS